MPCASPRSAPPTVIPYAYGSATATGSTDVRANPPGCAASVAIPQPSQSAPIAITTRPRSGWTMRQ